jgi:hypothetical protein
LRPLDAAVPRLEPEVFRLVARALLERRVPEREVEDLALEVLLLERFDVPVARFDPPVERLDRALAALA